MMNCMSLLAAITSWTENVADLGPIYPLVGYEGWMTAACALFCLWFMVVKFRRENAKYDKKVKQLGNGDGLTRAMSDDPLRNSLHKNHNPSKKITEPSF